MAAAGPAAGSPPPLQSNGWLVPFRLVTATAVTAAANDGIIYADATGAAITVTIPLAASVPAGTRIAVKKKDSGGNAVTVARSGSDTFDGGTSISLAAQYNSCVLVSDGVSEWLRASNAVATGGI